ncbi:DsbA family protein [Brucella pseudogrignonensis]|uniref:DsbA family protein n=1 Tax=Brucella pseudogrignonensis TaxID=419475 RepID=UPI00124F6481|nr:DsbA family protein [Brucella pseudogrignonensis]KAB2683653.1 DsbA family protein [Brucella pseudogrignonensis]
MPRLTIPLGVSDHRTGPDSAPLSLVEYGDYECPYCGEAYPVLKLVQQALGEELNFVFRNFPLTEMHPHAFRAAEFAEMAASAGKFWQAHDMLYENQNALTDEDLLRYGKALGIDEQLIERAFDGTLDQKIRADFSGGIHSGVNGTPTLFINGIRYDGPRDAQSLVTILREVDSDVSARG